MSEPRTEAGRRLLSERIDTENGIVPLIPYPEWVAAIEAEAVAAYVADLRAKVEGLPGVKHGNRETRRTALRRDVLALLDPERNQPKPETETWLAIGQQLAQRGREMTDDERKRGLR